MAALNPPFVELSFYIANRADADTFNRVFDALISLNAKYKGHVLLQKKENARSETFESVTDKDPFEYRDIALTNWSQISVAADVRILEAYFENAIGLSKEAPEVLTYVHISSQAKEVDQHPVSILTEGEFCCGPRDSEEMFSEKAYKAGDKVYNRFLQLIQLLNPDYASITVEYGLECLIDLKRNLRSLAFRDFFIRKSYVGQDKLNIIRNIFEDAYQEEVKTGLYVSSSPWFIL